MCLWCQCWEGRGRWIPGTYQTACWIQWQTLSQKLRWRITMEIAWTWPLASPCMWITCMHTGVYLLSILMGEHVICIYVYVFIYIDACICMYAHRCSHTPHMCVCVLHTHIRIMVFICPSASLISFPPSASWVTSSYWSTYLNVCF